MMLAVCLGFLISTPWPQDQQQSTWPRWLTPEQQKTFALLDLFDPLDTSTLDFVEVARGRRDDGPVGQRPHDERYGFLLRVDGRRFLVRSIDLNRELLTETPADTPIELRVGFAPADLGRFALDFAARLVADRDDPGAQRPCRSPATPLTPETLALLVARACARRGMQHECEALLGAASGDGAGGTRWLAGDLATRLALDFGDLELSWNDLLHRHDAWLAAFPGAGSEEIAKRREALARQIDGEAARSGTEPNEAAELAALIRDLRNACRPTQSGGFDSWSVDPLEPPPPSATRAFDALVARGLDAVPALLQALDDRSLTRSTTYSSRHGGWFDVRPLGRLAEDVLVEIAGARMDWKTWYPRAREIGVRGALAEVARGGSISDMEAIASYLARWPEDPDPAIEALRDAPRDRKQYYARTIARAAAKTGGGLRTRIVDLLREQIRGADAEYRVSLATDLADLGDDSGTRAILDSWRIGVAPDETALGIVLSSGVAEAWQMLHEHFGSDALRHAFASVVHDALPRSLFSKIPVAEREATERLFLSCLVALLRDPSPFGEGVTCKVGTRRVDMHVASRADIAACALATWWPESFRFDAARTASVRRLSIDALREGRQPPRFEGPAQRKQADDPALAEILGTVLRDGPSSPGFDRLRAAGLDALPRLDRAWRALPADHPMRRPLSELAAQLANTVREVELAPGLPDDVQASLLGLRGTPLDPQTLRDALVSLAKTAGLQGKMARLHIERTGEGLGAGITCELREREFESTTGCDYDVRVTCDGVTKTRKCSDLVSGDRVDPSSPCDEVLGPVLRHGLRTDPAKALEITLGLQMH